MLPRLLLAVLLHRSWQLLEPMPVVRRGLHRLRLDELGSLGSLMERKVRELGSAHIRQG